MKKKQLIVIAGNLGAGKTTLARKVGEKLGWFVGYESVSDNPYLTDFYANMNKWSYHLQLYFLGHRAEQHLLANNYSQSAILDRSIYEDAFIFAKALHKSGKIDQRDYLAYMKLFNLVTKNLPSPTLLIHVKSPVDILLKRIKQRGQEFDKELSSEYLSMIESYYGEWLRDFDICPILSIDSEFINYADSDEGVDLVLDQIRIALADKP